MSKNKLVITLDINGCVPISAFNQIVDVQKVAHYSLKMNKNGTLTLKFYDSNGKLVRPYAKK